MGVELFTGGLSGWFDCVHAVVLRKPWSLHHVMDLGDLCLWACLPAGYQTLQRRAGVAHSKRAPGPRLSCRLAIRMLARSSCL
jgi:hypothetical protein